MLFQTQFVLWVCFHRNDDSHGKNDHNGNHTHGRNCVWNNIYGRNCNNRNDIYDRNDIHGRNDDIPRRNYNNGNETQFLPWVWFPLWSFLQWLSSFLL
jgi:hypothetical protein